MTELQSTSSDSDLEPKHALRTGPLSEASLLGTIASEPSGLAVPEIAAPQAGVYQALIGLLAGYAVLTVGNGLFGTLIPLRMLHAGFSTLMVGLVQSSYFGGFILGAMFNRGLIERIGQHRAFVAFSATAAILALAFATFDSPLVLAAVRLCGGFAFIGLYTAVESWLNGAVPNAMRGRVFGSYLTINYLAVGMGQFLLRAGDAGSEYQLLIVAALFAGAVLPVTLLEGWPTRVADDRLARPRSHTWLESVREMSKQTPLAVPGCVLSGFLYSSFYSMTPVFLTRIGFSVGNLSLFMGITLISALIPQWPIGKLSDRVDRRLLVQRIAMACTLFSATLIFIHQHWFVGLMTFLYAALTFTHYGLIVSHVNDRTEPERSVATSATLLILFSIGGMTGPAIASLMMTALGPSGLFVFNCATSATLAYVALRALRMGQ
jgi:MFS family permease